MALPALAPVAIPKLPGEFPTVATAVLFELQLTVLVMSWVEESSNTPVALKFACADVGMITFCGVTEIETILALVTVRATEAEAEPRVAVTVTVPGATPNPSPLDAPIARTDVSDDDHAD